MSSEHEITRMNISSTPPHRRRRCYLPPHSSRNNGSSRQSTLHFPPYLGTSLATTLTPTLVGRSRSCTGTAR
jgi:hypothetical protein